MTFLYFRGMRYLLFAVLSFVGCTSNTLTEKERLEKEHDRLADSSKTIQGSMGRINDLKEAAWTQVTLQRSKGSSDSLIRTYLVEYHQYRKEYDSLSRLSWDLDKRSRMVLDSLLATK